jgi:hypothetical protein
MCRSTYRRPQGLREALRSLLDQALHGERVAPPCAPLVAAGQVMS